MDLKGRPQTTFTKRGRYICGPKMSTFCQRLYHIKCQPSRGLGGQKKETKSCKRSL